MDFDMMMIMILLFSGFNYYFLNFAAFKIPQNQCISSLALLPEVHQMLHKSIRSFAEQELKPIAGKLDKTKIFPKEEVKNKIIIQNLTQFNCKPSKYCQYV